MLTVLFPRLLTLQLRYAVFPTRAVTLRGMLASKKGSPGETGENGPDWSDVNIENVDSVVSAPGSFMNTESE